MIAGLTMWVSGGTTILDACREAQRIADAADRAVQFQFNSVRCVALPKGDGDRLADLYQDAIASEIVVYSNEAVVHVERREKTA